MITVGIDSVASRFVIADVQSAALRRLLSPATESPVSATRDRQTSRGRPGAAFGSATDRLVPRDMTTTGGGAESQHQWSSHSGTPRRWRFVSLARTAEKHKDDTRMAFPLRTLASVQKVNIATS